MVGKSSRVRPGLLGRVRRLRRQLLIAIRKLAARLSQAERELSRIQGSMGELTWLLRALLTASLLQLVGTWFAR